MWNICLTEVKHDREASLGQWAVCFASNQNLTDKMIHILQSWLDMVKKEAEPGQQVCAASLDNESRPDNGNSPMQWSSRRVAYYSFCKKTMSLCVKGYG